MRYIALIIFAVMTVAPVSAQYATLRPRGAVPLLDGCNGMSGYPDCHPDRGSIIFGGRSVATPVPSGIGRAPPTQFYPMYPMYPMYRR